MSKIPQKGPGGGGGLFWPFVWWLILNVAQNFKKYLRRNREKGEGGGGGHLSSKEKTPAGSWGEGAFCLLGWW